LWGVHFWSGRPEHSQMAGSGRSPAGRSDAVDPGIEVLEVESVRDLDLRERAVARRGNEQVDGAEECLFWCSDTGADLGGTSNRP